LSAAPARASMVTRCAPAWLGAGTRHVLPGQRSQTPAPACRGPPGCLAPERPGRPRRVPAGTVVIVCDVFTMRGLGRVAQPCAAWVRAPVGRRDRRPVPGRPSARSFRTARPGTYLNDRCASRSRVPALAHGRDASSRSRVPASRRVRKASRDCWSVGMPNCTILQTFRSLCTTPTGGAPLESSATR